MHFTRQASADSLVHAEDTNGTASSFSRVSGDSLRSEAAVGCVRCLKGFSVNTDQACRSYHLQL